MASLALGAESFILYVIIIITDTIICEVLF